MIPALSFVSRVAKRAVLCFLLIAFYTGCLQRIDHLGVQITVDQRKLSNGLVVMMVSNPTFSHVSYQTWYRVGSVDETFGLTGTSHLFEHLMFRGTPRFEQRQFFMQLEANGAEVNAYTTRDYTVYYENFAPPLLEKVVDMEADRMAHLILNEKTLETERMVALEERRLRSENDSEGRMQEALWQLAFHYHPYQTPVMGYPADLFRISVPQLTEYYQDYFQPANAAIVIVGNFDVNSTFALIKKEYGTIGARARPPRKIRPEPEQLEERRLILRDLVTSERFAQAYHVTSAEEEDSYVLDVLANILFEGTRSRAYRRLVEDRNLAVQIAGSAFTPTFPGLFIVVGKMKGGIPSSQAEAELDKVIREVQDHGVTEDEVQIAVKQLTVQLIDSVRTPFGLGQVIGTTHMVFGNSKRFAEDLSRYVKVKKADVRRVARKYLNPNNRSVVTLVPGQKS